MKKADFTIPAAIISFLALCMPFSSLGQLEKAAQGKDNLSPIDTIHVVGHAHMDMNWLWTYAETMQMCNDNLRQTVAFMEEWLIHRSLKK